MTDETPEQATVAPEAAPPEESGNRGIRFAPYRPELPPQNEGSGRYAVYDTQLERYVGEVTGRKPSDSAARKLAPNGYAIREV